MSTTCPFCAEEIQPAAIKCRHCGSFLDGREEAAPAPTPPLGGLIPVSNPPALIAYYTALFSIIPCVGLLLGPIGFTLGIIGRNKVAKDPRIGGTAHAWIGIILGGIVTLLHVVFLVLPFIARAMR